jgi:hypothetical protein
MKVLIFFVVIIFSFELANAQTVDSVIALPATIKNEPIKPEVVKPTLLKKKGYSIEMPINWTIMANCTDNLCSILAPGDTLGGFDIFTENINFTVQPITGYTAEKYAQFSINYLPTVVKNFKVVDKKSLKPNVYRLTYKGEKSGFGQTWRQYYHVKAGKVYIVTFACETTKYAYYQPIIEPFLNSFKLF